MNTKIGLWAKCVTLCCHFYAGYSLAFEIVLQKGAGILTGKIFGGLLPALSGPVSTW